MEFTNEQIENLIALGSQIAHIADAVPAPPEGADRTEWAASLRPALAEQAGLLVEMLAILTSGANPTPETLEAIVAETVVVSEPEKASMAERWASTFPTPAPVPDNLRYPRVMPTGEFQK